MRIGRAIVIPIVLALSTAGSILAASAAPAAAAQVPAAHAHVATSVARPDIHYHT